MIHVSMEINRPEICYAFAQTICTKVLAPNITKIRFNTYAIASYTPEINSNSSHLTLKVSIRIMFRYILSTADTTHFDGYDSL